MADHIAPLLEAARRNTNGQWSALCPAHDDTKRSLSIRTGTRGQRIVWDCHALECGAAKVRPALLDLGVSAACIPWRPDAATPRKSKADRDADTLAEIEKLLGDQPHPVEFMVRVAELLWEVDSRTAAKRAGISQSTFYRHRKPK